jgi:transmembrane sensor
MPDSELQKQLALWIIRLNCDDEAQRKQAQQDFSQWQQLHPEAEQLLSKMQAFAGDLSQLSSKHRMSTEVVNKSFAVVKKSADQVAKIFRQTLLSFLFAALMFGCYQLLPWAYYFADYRTSTAQTLRLQLEDGSHIRLGAKSAFNLHFDGQQRRIELLQGSVYVDVAKDHSRPFVVHADYADFKALGTAFIVYQDPQHSSIDMLHSAVTASSTAPQPYAALTVRQGQHLSVGPAGLGQIQSIDPNLVQGSWQQDLILAQNMPLPILLKRLQGYHHDYLIFSSARLNQIKINGMIDAKQDLEHNLALIQAKNPQLKVTHIGPFIHYLSLDDAR